MYQKSGGQYIKSVVFGGLDGILNIFSLSTGIIGSGIPVSTIWILGISTLIANALSMGLGDFISEKAGS